jgi:hypothetical protein
MKPTICTAILLALLPLQSSQAEEDPRFVLGNLGVENSYLKEFSEIVLKAFDRSGWSLSGLEGVRQIGGAYVVSGFVSLDEIQEPITEKDFERINGYFDSFIQAQIDLYEKKGLTVRSRQNDFPLASSAKGYTKNEIPRMTYIISGEKTDLFLMDITFAERQDNHLVIGFTIVTVP